MSRRSSVALVAVIAGLVAASCGSSADTVAEPTSTTISTIETGSDADGTTTTMSGGSTADEASDGLFPEVVGVVARQAADGTWTFDVTLSSPYDTPERYADAWRIEAPDGTVLGIRELAHDHQNEQPFTRSTSGVEILGEIRTVVVRGRDQVNGWSSDAISFELPG